MSADLLKLASIGSKEILTAPLPAEEHKLSSWGWGSALFDWLSKKNGFYAFESALHIFPLGTKDGVTDVERWNSAELWRDTYGDLAEGYLFFGEDVFGNQFCLKQDGIGSFDAETAEVTHLANNLSDWAKLVLKQYELHTGYPLAHRWQLANRPLQPEERLIPRMPFVTGGPYDIENLHAIDSVKGMRGRGKLAVQIQSLPDGAQLQLKNI
jgi:hypothetical protein